MRAVSGGGKADFLGALRRLYFSSRPSVSASGSKR
jgi:hypothetical protein